MGSVFALLLATAGCHSKTDPTPENFIVGLNAYFSDHSECLFPSAPRFPFETSDPAELKQMDALVKAQLLTVAKEPAIHVSRYITTTTGARSAPRFCYGHRFVTGIDSSTPPAKANGFTETQVTYHYELRDVPIWAKTPEVLAAFPAMEQATSGTSSGKATLAGTMVGWQVPD
ncbi:hypothetical protein [Granulicella arctica]|uniref:Uncharacterized protein n=1 Tax=Granulicella arctica TaxID=940613 RepID=A0A7Y9TJC2_9BACT|nr:hypothetical protein [Granulicella arctica]NYF78132.1 hypothetical protein [Granulicella arctica]